MDTTKALIEKYKLSEDEHKKIYELIEKQIFKDMVPSENPTAIIVGTQSGAGKGGLIQFSREEVEKVGENIKIITTDEYKPFHPRAIEIARKHPTQYVKIVEVDAGLWTGEILQKAINEKFSFIFECTLKNNRIMERIKELKNNGFKVILRSLAVPRMESMLSIFERYQCQMDTLGFGRLVTSENHDKSYDGMRNVIEEIEESKLCDNVEIYLRGRKVNEPKLVYSSTKDFNKYYNSKNALDKYRNQEEDKMTEKMVRNRIDCLKDAFMKRNANVEEFEQLGKLEILYKDIYNSKKIKSLD